VFDENPIFDFTCDGDGDWCDDVDNRPVTIRCALRQNDLTIAAAT
jgi:hypothetical protein